MRSTLVVPLKLAPVVAQRLGHVAEGGRALEDHVFEQVGHAGLAVAFVARADQDGHVDGDRRPRRLGEQQHAGAVGEPVFGDAFDRGDLLRLRRAQGAKANSSNNNAGQRRMTTSEVKNDREARNGPRVSDSTR